MGYRDPWVSGRGWEMTLMIYHPPYLKHYNMLTHIIVENVNNICSLEGFDQAVVTIKKFVMVYCHSCVLPSCQLTSSSFHCQSGSYCAVIWQVGARVASRLFCGMEIDFNQPAIFPQKYLTIHPFIVNCVKNIKIFPTNYTFQHFNISTDILVREIFQNLKSAQFYQIEQLHNL